MENEEIYSLLKQGEILEVEKAINSVRLKDKNILILTELLVIFHDEVNSNSIHTVFDYSTDFEELSRHYIRTKLLLRRLEFDMPPEYLDEFYDYCENTGVSIPMLCRMIRVNVLYKEKVCLGLSQLYGDKKGKDSMEYGFYKKLSKCVMEGGGK
jgi:hypothetical protein